MLLYHDCEGIASNSTTKSMVFTGYCQKYATQISLFNKNFEKAWLSAPILGLILRLMKIQHFQTANFVLRLLSVGELNNSSADSLAFR